MRIGISTACFYPQMPEQALPVIAGLGVRAIEVFFNTESEFSPRYYEQLGAQARSLGLEVISIHPYTSLMEGMLLFSDYRRRTEDGMMQYQRYFECAAALGMKQPPQALSASCQKSLFPAYNSQSRTSAVL